MTPKEFVFNALRTLSNNFFLPTLNPPVGVGSATNINVDVLHSIVGCVTESSEMLDVFKKNAFYGKPVDYVNLDEEFGDLLWYVAIYANARGIEIEQLMATNIAKLRVRYPQRFTAVEAETRDLAAERKVLEA